MPIKFRLPWVKKVKRPPHAGTVPGVKRGPYRTKAQKIADRIEALRLQNSLIQAEVKNEELRQRKKQIKNGETERDDLHIELGDLRRIDKMIRPLGMKIMTEKGDALEDENGFSSVMKKAFQNLGAGAAIALMQRQSMVAAPTYAQPELPAPPVATVSATPEPSPVVSEPEQPMPPQEGNMILIVQYVRASLESKNPDQAARWLMSQNRPEAQQLIRMLCTITDEQIPAALAELERQQPSAASLVQWLRSRPQWTLDTVHAIRALAANTEQEATNIMGL